MQLVSKALFWTFTIGLGFVNPLISIVLIVLYFLPQIITDICQPCNEKEFQINSFSEDVTSYCGFFLHFFSCFSINTKSLPQN